MRALRFVRIVAISRHLAALVAAFVAALEVNVEKA
jgi:hypothetical protein